MSERSAEQSADRLESGARVLPMRSGGAEDVPTPFIEMAFVALDDHHRLSEPILVEVTRDTDGLTVTDKLISRFGEGATVADALSDYACNVLDYFTMLRERRDRLSPRLARHLRILEDRIQEV